MRQTDPLAASCTQMEPNAATTAPGLRTWMVRFAGGSGDEGGSVDGETETGKDGDGVNVPAGADVVGEAVLHPASATIVNASLARRSIGQR